jgi:microsomal epoxide hydrolase
MTNDLQIRPFRIEIPQADLDDLQSRLARTAGSSARLYFEAAPSGGWGPPAHSATPTGVAVFPYEIAPLIRRFAELSDNIVHWSELDRGGHFAAMEGLDLLVADVRQFFSQLR